MRHGQIFCRSVDGLLVARVATEYMSTLWSLRSSVNIRMWSVNAPKYHHDPTSHSQLLRSKSAFSTKVLMRN